MNWKIPGWAAAAGAVVSLAAGLAGGNGFGTILLRALVSALIAGALGFAAQYVLRRFLPGFGSKEAPPPGVDILIDEEVPLAAEAPRGQGEEFGAAREEALSGEAEAEPFPKLPEAGSFAPQADGLAALAEAGESLEPVEGVEELPSGETLEALSAADPDDLLADTSEITPPGRRALKAEELEAQLDSVTKGQDPASLAKAVRTFLRKDQEG